MGLIGSLLGLWGPYTWPKWVSLGDFLDIFTKKHLSNGVIPLDMPRVLGIKPIFQMVGVSYHQRLLFELLPFHAFKGARRDGKKEMQLENRAAMTLSSPNRWRSRTNQPLSLGHVFTHSPSVERPQRITRRTRVG